MHLPMPMSILRLCQKKNIVIILYWSAPTSLARSYGDYLGILIEDTGIDGFAVDMTRARRIHGQGRKGRPYADKKGGERGLDLNF